MKKALQIHIRLQKYHQKRPLDLHWRLQHLGQDRSKGAGSQNQVILGILRADPNARRKRPRFEELLAKYNKGAIQKQKNRPNKVKSIKSSPKSRERLDSCQHQGNEATASYTSFESVSLWFWSYPCYYSPSDYSRMYMQ